MRRPVTEDGRTRTYRLFSPRAQGYRGRGTRPLQMGGVGDVGQGAADDHAPAGPGRLLDRVDLEGDRLPLHGGIQLGFGSVGI